MMTGQNNDCFLSDLFSDTDDLRRALAQHVIDMLWSERQIRAYVCDEHCPDCHAFLVELEGQSIPHCWFCTADRRNAQIGHNQLTKAKIRYHSRLVACDEYYSPGREMFGMPL